MQIKLVIMLPKIYHAKMRARSIRSMAYRKILSWMFCVLLAAGCTETVPVSEADLESYEQISPFLAGKTSVEYAKLNVSDSILEARFHTSHTNAISFFDVVNTSATKQGWKMIDKSDGHRTYEKFLHMYPAQTSTSKVLLRYDDKKMLVYLKWY